MLAKPRTLLCAVALMLQLAAGMDVDALYDDPAFPAIFDTNEYGEEIVESVYVNREDAEMLVDAQISLGMTKAQPESLNFFTAMGLTRDATEVQMRSAYKKLSIKFHPDKLTQEYKDSEVFKTAFIALSGIKQYMIDDKNFDSYKESLPEHRAAARSARRVVGAKSKTRSASRSRSPIPTKRQNVNRQHPRPAEEEPVVFQQGDRVIAARTFSARYGNSDEIAKGTVGTITNTHDGTILSVFFEGQSGESKLNQKQFCCLEHDQTEDFQEPEETPDTPLWRPVWKRDARWFNEQMSHL